MVPRTAVNADESGEYLDHASGADAVLDSNYPTFARVLVNDREARGLLPAGARVVHEVIRLDWLRQFPVAARAMTRRAPRPGVPTRKSPLPAIQPMSNPVTIDKHEFLADQN